MVRLMSLLTNERKPVATTTTTDAARLNGVLDAMQSVQSEDDRWHLAEALHTLIKSGTNGFDKVLDAATAKGVSGGLSATTLRLYRDTAARWPSAKRVPGVSFSAHREAMVMIAPDGSTQKAEKLLKDLAKNGADKVTVKQVRQAAAISSGKTARAQAGAGKTAAPKGFDVLNDLENGAKQVLDSINSIGTDTARLDKVHAGVSKALARVEQLRAKAQRAKKATPTKVSSTPPASKPVVNGKGKVAASKRGDLRDL
jgi:hypothetical protein